MAFDGNGTFNRVYNWTQDKANSIDITASRMDTEDSGFAAGLSLAVTRDGQGKMAADFTPASDLTYQLGTGGLRWNGFNGKSINHILPQAVFKPTTTARTNLTTPTADPDLILPVTTTGTYILEVLLGLSATTTTAQGFRFTLSTAASIGFAFNYTLIKASWSVPVGGSVGGSASLTNLPTSIFTSLTDVGAVSGQIIHLKAGIVVSSVDGASIQVYWAQNSSSANAVSVLAGSYMTLTRID